MIFMAEIRLRDVSPDFLKKLDVIQKDLKEKTATGAIEKLIEGYANTQSHIKQLSQRNTELHRRLQHYFDIEESMKDNVKDLIFGMQSRVVEAKKLLQTFGKKQKAGTKRSQARKGRTR
jgi:hypothetical protein